MAPGFVLFLFAVALAAISPFIFVVLLACLFFGRLRSLAMRYMGIGIIVGAMAISGHALAIALFTPSTPLPSFEFGLGLFGFGFSSGILWAVGLRFASRLASKRLYRNA